MPTDSTVNIAGLGMANELTDAAFRAVVEEAPDAIVLVDGDGIIAFVNAQTELLFGYGRSELTGQRVEVLVPVVQRSMHTIHRDIYQERPEKRPMGTGLELFGQRKDGSTFPVEISLSPSSDTDGRLTVAVVRDVTRQRRGEEALRRSEERHRLLNERADSVIFRYRIAPERGFEYVSSAVRRNLGYSPEEFYVDAELPFALAVSEDRDALRRVLSGEIPAATVRVVGRDQQVRWLEIDATAVRATDGSTIALEGIARDITERRLAEEERLLLLAEVEMQSERNRLVGDLHDDTLQSIYAVGLGLHSMRDDAAVPREEIVDRTVDGLNEVIASLRAYMHRLSGTEDEAGVGEPLAHRIGSLIEQNGSTSWTLDVDPALSLEAGIERQIYLLGKELVSNVQRHAHANTARLALRRDADGNVELAVVDDGVGFERERVGAGSFGMRSVARRAEIVGATLLVESAPGDGTHVRVSIPREALASAQADHPTP